MKRPPSAALLAFACSMFLTQACNNDLGSGEDTLQSGQDLGSDATSPTALETCRESCQGVCDETAQCVQCIQTADCPADTQCSSAGECVQCVDRSQCREDEVCTGDGTCAAAECATDAECGGDQACFDGICGNCEQSDECAARYPDAGNAPVCVDNTCVQTQTGGLTAGTAYVLSADGGRAWMSLSAGMPAEGTATSEPQTGWIHIGGPVIPVQMVSPRAFREE